jgi:hypothetical protein
MRAAKVRPGHPALTPCPPGKLTRPGVEQLLALLVAGGYLDKAGITGYVGILAGAREAKAAAEAGQDCQ